MPTHRTTDELDTRLIKWYLSRENVPATASFGECLDELLKEVGY